MTTYVSDSFTGTNGTLLKNHAPDIGGTWVHPYFVTTGFTDCETEISSNVGRRKDYAGSIDDSWYYNSTAVPADCEVTMSVNIVGGYSADFEISLTLHGTASDCVKGYLNPKNGIAGIASIYVLSAGGDPSSQTPTMSCAPGSHTIKFNCISGVYSLYWDGVLVRTRTVTPPSSPGYSGIQASTTNFTPGDLVFDNYLAVSAGPPPPPPVFWTSFLNSHEVP